MGKESGRGRGERREAVLRPIKMPQSKFCMKIRKEGREGGREGRKGGRNNITYNIT